MAQVDETPLPGVGARFDFTTSRGQRIGVISHKSGDRELLIYGRDDPDACAHTIRFDDDDLRVLGELLGAAHVVERLAAIPYTVEGLTIDWLKVNSGSEVVGETLAATELRTRTGVSVVAVIRGDDTIPSPGADFALAAGDTAVVVGTGDGVRSAIDLFQGN